MRLDSISLDSINSRIVVLNDSLDKVDSIIYINKKNVDKYIKDRQEFKRKLNKIKNTPNNKRGDELINSLNKRLKKL